MSKMSGVSELGKSDKRAGKRRRVQTALLAAALGFGAFAAFAQSEAPREWKSRLGKTVVTGTLDVDETFANFPSGAEKPETVYFSGNDGKRYRYRYSFLDDADQKRVDVALGLTAEVVDGNPANGANSANSGDSAEELAARAKAVFLQLAEEADARAWSGEYAAGTAKSLTIKGETYTFHYCPTGSFTMGGGDYIPHTVYLDGFWMLETEVTQAMWKSLMGSNPSGFSSSGGDSSKVSGMDTSNFPVEKVSWNDCQEFIAKLNSLGVAPSGFKFRLPSEAEWEYACRAGSSGDYAGSSLDSLGWYHDNSGDRTHKVATKSANPWGLYDMHGNVCEWCEDWYDSGYYEKSNNARNPINATPGSRRVLRGGGCIFHAKHCRSASRDNIDPTERFAFDGFRLALVRSSSSGK